MTLNDFHFPEFLVIFLSLHQLLALSASSAKDSHALSTSFSLSFCLVYYLLTFSDVAQFFLLGNRTAFGCLDHYELHSTPCFPSPICDVIKGSHEKVLHICYYFYCSVSLSDPLRSFWHGTQLLWYKCSIDLLITKQHTEPFYFVLYSFLTSPTI